MRNILFIIIFTIVIGIIVYRHTPPPVQPLPADKSYGAPAIGGGFTLIDQNGNLLSDESLRGKYMLVSFGFTHCPEVCPTNLATMTLAMETLDKNKAVQVTPIFITVDPERDTAQVIKVYLRNYHPTFIGLTGTAEQIKQVAAEYKIYYKKAQELAEDEGYDMEHSAYIYLMDKGGKFLQYFPYNSSYEAIVQEIEGE